MQEIDGIDGQPDVTRVLAFRSRVKLLDWLYSKFEKLVALISSTRPIGIGSFDNNPAYVGYLVEQPLYRIKASILEIDERGNQRFGALACGFL